MNSKNTLDRIPSIFTYSLLFSFSSRFSKNFSINQNYSCFFLTSYLRDKYVGLCSFKQKQHKLPFFYILIFTPICSKTSLLSVSFKAFFPVIGQITSVFRTQIYKKSNKQFNTMKIIDGYLLCTDSGIRNLIT